jgi:hypothetical protein
MSEIRDAADHLDAALEHHAAGRHSSVKRRVELARACIQRAIDANGHDAETNPTAAAGAQTSAGQSSGESGRAHEPKSIRERDQLASCRLAYQERMRQISGAWRR